MQHAYTVTISVTYGSTEQRDIGHKILNMVLDEFKKVAESQHEKTKVTIDYEEEAFFGCPLNCSNPLHEVPHDQFDGMTYHQKLKTDYEAFNSYKKPE